MTQKTIKIREGEAERVPAGTNLIYPGINSCLTITAVYAGGERCGGHVVMFPEGSQKSLQEICDFIKSNGNASQLFIVGDIETWNQNWSMLPQCQQLKINGKTIKKVAEIASALDYPSSNVVFDTYSWGVGTYDIYFNQNGSRGASDGAGGSFSLP